VKATCIPIGPAAFATTVRLDSGESIDVALARALERERELWNRVRGKHPGNADCPEATWLEWAQATELVRALAAERVRSMISPNPLSSPCERFACWTVPQAPVDDVQADRTATPGQAGVAAPRQRARRGFALIDPQRQREIASLGGKAAHSGGHAYQFTSEDARAAGLKRQRAKAVQPEAE
jgi:general stress protein YciG